MMNKAATAVLIASPRALAMFRKVSKAVNEFDRSKPGLAAKLTGMGPNLLSQTSALAMSYHLDPDDDPNVAYAVIPMPAELRGRSDYWIDWWTVTRNGVPVRHYPPRDRDLAERFATDRAYRQQLADKNKAYEP